MEYDIQHLFENLLTHKVQLPQEMRDAIDVIVENSEKQKGVMTVVFTGLVYKHYHPGQDVRYHQRGMDGGYSGRSFDSQFITPFLRDNSFPRMAESGWLTRSLEQHQPYDKNYKGQISGKGVKEAFLNIYEATTIQELNEPMLAYFFQKMQQKRDDSHIALICPANLTIDTTLSIIKRHINAKYQSSGASRLPHIAIHAAYMCGIHANQGRYKDKAIESIQAHTASDRSSGAIGDVQINDTDGNPFEGIEIKARAIEVSMIKDVYRKIQQHSTVSRYYVLTTCEDKTMNDHQIQEEVAKIRINHGCEVIVNGVFTTLQYFLRLSATKDFIKLYTELITKDEALKFEHKSKWNELCLDMSL